MHYDISFNPKFLMHRQKLFKRLCMCVAEREAERVCERERYIDRDAVPEASPKSAKHKTAAKTRHANIGSLDAIFDK